MNLKRILKVVGIILLVLLGIVYFSFQKKDLSLKNDRPILVDTLNNESDLELMRELEKYYTAVLSFDIINVEELTNRISNNECFFLYVGRSTCEWCRKLAPILQVVVQNLDIDICYLDSENSDTNLSVKEFRELYSIQEVPAILFFSKNGDYVHIDIEITNSEFGVESLTEALQKYVE